MREWTLDLPGRLPASMNQRERLSYWARKKELDEITEEIRAEAERLGIPPATSQRQVLVTIHKGKRSRKRDDPGNRFARGKAPLDALVRLGLLTDDDDAGLDWLGVVEGEREDSKRTLILLREIG